MASKGKTGGSADVHNEFTRVKRANKKKERVWARKCNHCPDVYMCRP